jgi:dTDP-4-amino-4,6-dideoxy-D-galactose acyltransferase
MDRSLPPGVFEKLYDLWLQKSFSGELADLVLVTDTIVPAGFITVRYSKQPEASVGLIAVVASEQGKGWGRGLIESAEQVARDAGQTIMRIPTQSKNSAACAFYERCGYRRDSVVHQTHLWIKN